MSRDNKGETVDECEGNLSQAPAAGWYADPVARHEVRYWDGRVWTPHVSDGGRTTVDPSASQSSDVVRGGEWPLANPEGPETVLLFLDRVSDVWGGIVNVYITSKRLVIDRVFGAGTSIGAVGAGGLIGGVIALRAVERSQANAQGKTVEEILVSSRKAYAIDYGDITEMVLTRRTLLGRSRCKIRSTCRNVTFEFRSAAFDGASEVLVRVLPRTTRVR